MSTSELNSNSKHLACSTESQTTSSSKSLEPITCLIQSFDYNETSHNSRNNKNKLIDGSKFPSLSKALLPIFNGHRNQKNKNYKENKHYLDLKKNFNANLENPIIKKSILMFSKKLIKHVEVDQIDLISTLIGKIIFLSDYHLSELNQCLDGNQLHQSMLHIDQLFRKILNQRIHEVEDWIKTQERIDPQEAHILSHNRVPVELAKLLITKNGLLNQQLISPLIAIFKEPSSDEPRPFKKNLVHKLEFLENSKAAAELLNSIKLCRQRKSSAQQIVKTVLKLPQHQKLTHTHAKQAALAAFLSHFRQPISGSCFANSLTIQLLSSRFLHCLGDFKNLLSTNTLTRKVHDQTMFFPFILTLHHHEINKEIKIWPNGMINPQSYIWEDPGLQSLCLAYDLNPAKSFISKALDLANQPQEKTFTIKEILSAIVSLAKKSHLTIDLANAYMMYESEKTNLLLQAWNNAIAGMAEADNSSMIKSSVIRSTLRALNVNFNTVHVSPEEILAKKKKFLTFLEKHLSEQIQFLYDANLSENRNASGFILYDKNHSLMPHKWIRVDSAEAFQNFIRSLVIQFKKTISSSDRLFINMLETFKQYVKDRSFLERLLNEYNYPLDREKTPLEELKTLKYTPWSTLSGNNALKVIQIYFEKNRFPAQTTLTPLNAHELLTKIIEIGKKELIAPKTFPLYPVRTLGLHSFSLVLWHPSLTQLLKADNPEQWVKEHLIQIGNHIANSPIKKETQSSIFELCRKKIVSLASLKAFEQAIADFNADLTHCQFRERLLSEIQKLDLKSDSSAEWIIDTLIFDHLPDDSKALLWKNAIHFADTNWCYGASDIYFCFVVNPGTGKLEVWESLNQEKILKPLDQKPWLSNRQWEFLSHPHHYLRQDEDLAA